MFESDAFVKCVSFSIDKMAFFLTFKFFFVKNSAQSSGISVPILNASHYSSFPFSIP